MLAPKQLGRTATIADMPTGGEVVISGRIEQYRALVVSQTTAGQTLSLPDPVDTSVVFGLDVVNSGTEAFSFYGQDLATGASARASWDGTQWAALAGGSASLTDTLLTAAANNVDLTAGNHDRVDGTSGMTVLDTVTLPTAPAVGEYGEFYNGSTVALVLAKDAGDAYFGSPSTAIPASSGFSWRCVAANTIEVVGTGEAGGGMIARGVATSDTDLGPGIYSMDASGGAFDFTLPAANGSQARYMLLGADVGTNAATVKVQAGESMNSSTDLTYTMSVNDETVLFIDEEVGLVGSGGWC